MSLIRTLLSQNNASRKGQAFSSAIKVATLDLDTEIEEIPDIERNNFNFSDGCGFIDQALLDKIACETYNHSMCSAIQIRMGGYKGMLLGYDKCKGSTLVYTRPSMKKFKYTGKHGKVDLEVVRLATYAPGYLSKQYIVMLWANGIFASKFVKMQKDYVNDMIACYNLEKIGIGYEFRQDLFQS